MAVRRGAGQRTRAFRVMAASVVVAASVVTGLHGLRPAAEGEGYGPRPIGPKTCLATNAAQGVQARFSSEVVSFRGAAREPWGVSLRTVAAGRGDALHPLDTVEPVASAGRIEYRRRGLTEWYVNDPRGVEQGFTLLERPAGNKGPVVLELEVASNLFVLPTKDAGGLMVVNSAGRPVAHYDGLTALGADGKELPSRIDLAGGRLRLSFADENAAYPVIVDPLISTQQAKLTPTDSADVSYAGCDVAVSGDTALVGADSNSGSAYVFVRSGATWSQQAVLTAPGASFTCAVALSGDTVVVGAARDDNFLGSAYVFVRSGVTWSLQAKLTRSDPAANQYFGSAVAVAGDTVIVGASGDDDHGRFSGSAYVFARSGAAWAQQAKLTPADGVPSAYFGSAIDVAGDSVVLGAPGDSSAGNWFGAAYVFARAGTSWSQQAKLVADDASPSDSFGWSVSISGDVALVGAPIDSDTAYDAGSAYVFVRSRAVWSQQAKLVAADIAAGDRFGKSVGVSGDVAVVGSPGDDDLGPDSGSAYLFGRSGTTWPQQAKLKATVVDAASAFVLVPCPACIPRGIRYAGDEFGLSAAISGDTVVVGAPTENAATYDGAAYVFAPCAALQPLGGLLSALESWPPLIGCPSL